MPSDQFVGVSICAVRPGYPDALFQRLKKACRAHDLVWDCATGSGQAAIPLAGIFKKVIATDASAEQLHQATAKKNIEYKQAAAEENFLPPHSLDLITVAQALHWFDIPAFFRIADETG